MLVGLLTCNSSAQQHVASKNKHAFLPTSDHSFLTMCIMPDLSLSAQRASYASSLCRDMRQLHTATCQEPVCGVASCRCALSIAMMHAISCTCHDALLILHTRWALQTVIHGSSHMPGKNAGSMHFKLACDSLFAGLLPSCDSTMQPVMPDRWF